MSYIDDIKRKYGLSSLDLYKKDQDYSSYISEKYGLSSKVEEDEEDYSERLAREISGSMGTTPRRQNLWIDEESYIDVSQSRGLNSPSEKVGDKFARDTAEGRSFGSSGTSYVDRENSRIKNALRYVTAGAMRSTVDVAGSLNPMAIVDSAYQLGSTAVGVVYNRVARGIGSDKEWEIKTLSQAVQDVIQRDGVAPFRTDNIKNETIKNVLEDINKGTGIIEGMNRRAQEFWQRNQDDVSERVSKATKITSMVVESIPQMALMLLGQGAYALSAASRAMLETRDDGKIDQREVERALWSANAEIFSEMIFGLYDDASVLIKGALTRQAGRVASDAAKGVATKITPLMLARGVALQGLEEGAEEVLSYIMQVGIDRNYLYPEKGYFDVFDFEELGTSALVGFLAGGIMSTPQAITNGRLEMSERRELIALADKFRNMDVKDIDAIKPNTKEAIEAARFVYLIQKGKDKRNPVDYDAVNEMDMESKTAFVSQNLEHTIDVDGRITRLTSLERMRPSGVLSTQATLDRNLQQQVEQESPAMAETAQESTVPTDSRSVEVSQSTMELGNQTVNTDRLSLGRGELMIMTNSPYAPNNMNSVYNFFVPEDVRRQGIGTALINEAKTRYGEKGISAQVSNENSLRLFYNNGFYPAQNPDATLDQALEMFRENESLNMRYVESQSRLEPTQTPVVVQEEVAPSQAEAEPEAQPAEPVTEPVAEQPERVEPKKRTVDMTPLNSLPTETAEVNGHEVQAIGEVRIAQPHGGNLTAFIVKAYKNAIDIVPNNRTRTNANPERWRYQPSTDTFRAYAGDLNYIRKSDVDSIIGIDTEPVEPAVQVKTTTAPVEEKAPVKKKAPAKKPIKKSDLTVMAERGAGSAEIHQAIKDWVKTDEAAKEFKDIKTPAEVAEAIIDYKQNFNERLASWKGKGGFLQMLAMLEWADRIKAAPEGSAVSLAMQHMTEALVSGQPDMVKSAIESRIDDDALFHVILTNNDQAEIAEGNKDKGEKYLVGLLKKVKIQSYTPAPHEVIYLLNHIKELQGTEGFGDDAYYIMQHLSARLTESGRAIQSMRLLRKIFPEYQAQAIIKSYESEIPQKDTFNLDRDTEITNEILEEVRDGAFDESVRDIQTTLNQYEDISNIAEPETEQDIRELEETQGIGSELDTLKKREQQNRAERKKARAENRRPRVRKVLSTSERLAIRIKNDVKRIDGAPKTEDEVGRLIDNLFKKYKQTLRDMNKPIPPTSFEQLADIVLNRKEYAVVWESAQENIKSDPQYAEHQALIEYLDTQSDPVMTKKLMERVVADTIKSEKVNLESAAKEYYLLGNKSLMRYKLKLNALMPTLDVKSREYMNEYIDDTFRKMMDKRRSNAVARLREQVRQSRKPVKEADPMNVFINNIYDAAYKDSLNEANKEIRQNWANRLGVPVLTDTMVKYIYDAAFSIAAQPDTDAQANELEKLLKKLSGEMKATHTEQLIALARAAMMSLPKTWTRNAATNAMAIPIYGLQDRIQLKIEERLGVTPSKRISSDKFIKADETTELGRYVLKHYSDKKIRQISAGSEKYNIKTFLGIEKIMFDNAKIDSLIKASYRITNDGEILGHQFKWLGDIGILSKHYRTALIRSLDVQGFDPSKGVKGQESIIAEAEKIALYTAIVRVFRQSTWVSTLFANMERTLSNPNWAKTARREGHYVRAEGIELFGKAGLLAVKILQPFVKTPAAIARQGFDWSPAALAIGVGKLIYNKQKHRIGVQALDTKRADDLAKHISKQIAGGLAGTISTSLMGFVLSALGFIEVDEPDDAKEKAAWDIMGRRRYYLKLPLGIRISLDYMQPISTGIIIGAHFGNMFNGDNFLEASEEAVVGALNSLLESTVLDSLSRAFGGSYNKTLSEKVRDFGIDGMTQLVPNVMRGLNRVVDPYVRDVYSGTPLVIAKNRVIQGVPFATYTIPSKIDLWGQPVRRSPIKGVFGVAERTVVNLVLPFTVSYENQDPVTKEVVRLFNEVEGSAGNKAIPSIPSATISRTETVDGQKVAKEWSLTGEDYENFLKEIGQMRYRAIQQALKDPEYKAKSSEEKIKVLNGIYTESSNIVRDKYVIENPNGWTPKE